MLILLPYLLFAQAQFNHSFSSLVQSFHTHLSVDAVFESIQREDKTRPLPGGGLKSTELIWGRSPAHTSICGVAWEPDGGQRRSDGSKTKHKSN